MDNIMTEGPYGYTDNEFNVTIKRGLSNIESDALISIDQSSGNNSMILERSSVTEVISLTTPDYKVVHLKNKLFAMAVK
jgi:hypothetical protein